MDVINLNDLIGDAMNSTSLPDPESYQYYSQMQKRRIVLNMDIDQALLEYAILPLIEMDNDGTGKPIEIMLNTYGGEIYSGFNLVDVIENLKTPTTIHIMGIAASMGLFIAMAGKHNPNVKTVCHPFSVGLLHSGSQCLEGSTHAVRDTFEFSRHYEDKIRDYVISHTNIDEALYEKTERNEYWMDANEMLRLGIVDEII